MISTILIAAETHNGEPLPVVAELVAAARSLADHVEAITWNGTGAKVAQVLGAHGVTRIHEVGDVGDSLVAPRVSAAIQRALDGGIEADALFVPSTSLGRDIAARCSARLDRPVLANIVGLAQRDGGIVTEHALFGGSKIARARVSDDGFGIYLIRPKSFVASEVGGPQAEVSIVAVAEAGATDGARVVKTHSEELSGPSLDSASVIVSGGRGLGNQEHYALIERLAQLLHGAPGATRAIVDAGWVPFSYQVGQTGRLVKPNIYLAFGISGATQHLVGMKDANRIVAVNKDPSAPIFSLADLGIVGDALDILPKLIEAIEARS